MSNNHVVGCVECGQKNRIPAPGVIAKCGKCKAALPVNKLTRPVAVAEMRNHIHSLASAFSVDVNDSLTDQRKAKSATWVRQLPKSAGGVNARYEKVSQEIIITPISSSYTYAIALHEMGHILHPEGHMDVRAHIQSMDQARTRSQLNAKLRSEQAAWEWAKHYALVWDAEMQRSFKDGITSYEVGHENMSLAFDLADQLQLPVEVVLATLFTITATGAPPSPDRPSTPRWEPPRGFKPRGPGSIKDFLK